MAGACGHADVIMECLLGLKCLLQKQYPFWYQLLLLLCCLGLNKEAV